jgi:hypothetical protein
MYVIMHASLAMDMGRQIEIHRRPVGQAYTERNCTCMSMQD